MRSGEIIRGESSFFARLAQREEQAGLTDAECAALDRSEIYDRILKFVGKTPLIRTELADGNVMLQKDETANPTETHYDRVYAKLLAKLEQQGRIRPGDILLEVTSGSAGVAFAWMARKLGYQSVIFVPSFVPQPRISLLQEMADEVHVSDDRVQGLAASVGEMKEYCRQNKERVAAQGKRMWIVNHSQDFEAPAAVEPIVPELIAGSGGLVSDYFIGGIGNGTTILGIVPGLRRANPGIRIICFEPARACPFKKRFVSTDTALVTPGIAAPTIPDGFEPHDMPGLGSFGNIKFPFMEAALERKLIDEIIAVDERPILEEMRRRTGREKEYGNGSLVAQWIIEQMAQTTHDSVFATIIYDRADRY